MSTLQDIRKATLEARTRLNDPSIGTDVEAGQFRIVRFTRVGSRAVVTPIAGPFRSHEVVAELAKL